MLVRTTLWSRQVSSCVIATPRLWSRKMSSCDAGMILTVGRDLADLACSS